MFATRSEKKCSIRVKSLVKPSAMRAIVGTKLIDVRMMPKINLVKSYSSLKRKLNDDYEEANEANDDDEDDSNFVSFKKPHIEMGVEYAKIELEENDKELKNELNERELWLIANEYDNLFEWQLLGRVLNLKSNELQSIEYKLLNSNNLCLKECLYQTLLRWRLHEPENCNFFNLASILTQKLSKPMSFIQHIKQKLFSKSSHHLNSTNLVIGNYINKLKENKIQLEELENVKLNEKRLWLASDILCTEWRSISRYLNIKESDLLQIENSYGKTDGLRECCYQSLLQWSQVYNDMAYLQKLCSFLIDIGFNLFAKQLIELFCF